MTATITREQQQAIAAFLDGKTIVSGLGSAEAACSVASINLALTGRLTDEIPDCMSRVIGRWIIHVQDSMPDDMRNSDEWRRLLPLAAGTGREHERERRNMVLDWMWGVLPILQTLADRQGFGDPWRLMCELRTAEATDRAKQAAHNAYAGGAYATNPVYEAYAYRAADAAVAACRAADDHAAAAHRAADAAADTAHAYAEDARRSYRAAEAYDEAWREMDPVGLLERLVAVSADGGTGGGTQTTRRKGE